MAPDEKVLLGIAGVTGFALVKEHQNFVEQVKQHIATLEREVGFARQNVENTRIDLQNFKSHVFAELEKT